MTTENVISGFRTTGVYLINRAADFIKTPVKSRMADLEAKKIHCLPLCPSLSRHTSPVHNTTFTTEEILRFQQCISKSPIGEFVWYLLIIHYNNLAASTQYRTCSQSQKATTVKSTISQFVCYLLCYSLLY